MPNRGAILDRRALAIFAVFGLCAVLIGGGSALYMFVFRKSPPAVSSSSTDARGSSKWIDTVKRAPVIQVVTTYPGMSAQTVEKSITNRIERWVNQAPGAARIDSKSVAGVSVVTVYFRDDIDPSTALTVTNSLALDALPNLPANTLPPVVLPQSDSALGYLTVSNAEWDEATVTGYAHTHVSQLLRSVPGCVTQGVVGGKDRTLERQSSRVRCNGRRMVIIPVYSEPGARAIDLAVQKALPGFQKRLPAGTKLDFLPFNDSGIITVTLRAPSGLSLEATEKRVAEVESFIADVIPVGDRRGLISAIGYTQDWSAARTANAGEQDATIQVFLSNDQGENAQELVVQLRKRFSERPAFADLRARFTVGALDSTACQYGSPAAVNIRVSGGKLEQAAGLAEQIRRRLASLKDAADVQLAQRLDAPELLIDIDREKTAAVGLTAQDIFVQTAAALKVALPAGREMWSDTKTGTQCALDVHYPDVDGRKLEDVLNVLVTGTNTPAPIKLGSLVRLQRSTTAVEINHADLVRTVNILVNHATGGDVAHLADDIETTLKGLAIPEGMRVEVLRRAKDASVQ